MDPNKTDEFPKRRKRSNQLPKVFDGTYFVVKHMTEDKILAICRTCDKELSGSQRSTGNFFSHIKRIHPEILSDCKAYVNGSLNANYAEHYSLNTNHEIYSSALNHIITSKLEIEDKSASSSYCDDDNTFLQKQLMMQPNYSHHNSTTFLPAKDVLNFLLSELLPISVLENNEFSNLLQDTVPSSETISHELNIIFNQMVCSVNGLLSNKALSIIVDITSNSPGKLIGVSATILDEYFQRKTVLLSVQNYTHCESFDNVINQLATTLSTFNISLENVSNIVFGKEISCNDFNYQQNNLSIVPETIKHPSYEKFKSFQKKIESCVFLMDLCYQDAIDYMISFDKIQTFHLVLNKLKIFWARLKVENTEVPIPTNLHWKNTFQPICSMIKNKPQIDNIMQQLNIDEPLTPDDWCFLSEFSCLIAPFHQASTILVSEHSLGYVLPTISTLITKIGEIKTEACKYFQTGIIVSLQKHFSKILNFENADFFVATISHPMFKLMWTTTEQYHYLLDLFTIQCEQLFTRTTQESISNDFFNFNCTSTWSNGREEINDYLQNKNSTISSLHGFPTIKKMFLKTNTTPSGTENLEEVLRKAELKVGYVEMKDLEKMLFIKENKKYF